MVYESGFTTRRTYSSRPVTTSYAVTYPSVQNVTRVYKTSYPIYSSYSIPRRVVTGTRVISSPVRVVTSPTRVVSRINYSPSPVRVVRTTTRVISSPERTSSYSYSTPSAYYSPTYLSSTYLPSSYYTSTYTPSTLTTYTPSYYYNPTTITRVYARCRSLSPVRITTSPLRVTPSYLKKYPPGYGARALTNYLNTEPFTTFSEETSRIRHRAQSLIRDLHTPVVRRARSCTPFPVTGYNYGPTSQLALDAYVARVTNPVRHIAKEVHNISYYPKPAVKYVGKSHLASVRICGDKAYNIRRPMYDSDKVRNDINLLSWYLRHPTWKNEKQANVPHKEDADLDPNRPSRKFSAPRSLEDDIDLESKEKQRLRQERLLTVNEEALDDLDVEKKRVQRADEANRRNELALAEEKKRIAVEKEEKRREAELKAKAEAEKAAKRAKEVEEAAQKAKEEEEARLAELALSQKAKEEEEARQAEFAAAQKAKEEEEARQAELAAAQKAKEEEETRQAELAAAQKAKEEEEARQAELAAAQKAKEEEEARLAEEETIRKAEEARLEEEQRIRAEELQRLAEIEKQAEEEREGDLARQAAELAEIARGEAEIAAQELQAIQKTELEAVDPIIDEPVTPSEEQVEPTIEINTGIEEVPADHANTATESFDEEDEEEEEEE